MWAWLLGVPEPELSQTPNIQPSAIFDFLPRFWTTNETYLVIFRPISMQNLAEVHAVVSIL